MFGSNLTVLTPMHETTCHLLTESPKRHGSFRKSRSFWQDQIKQTNKTERNIELKWKSCTSKTPLSVRSTIYESEFNSDCEFHRAKWGHDTLGTSWKPDFLKMTTLKKGTSTTKRQTWYLRFAVFTWN